MTFFKSPSIPLYERGRNVPPFAKGGQGGFLTPTTEVHLCLKSCHYKLKTVLLFCITFLLLSRGAEATPHPRFGGKFQQAIFQTVTTLDPVNYLNFAELQIATNLYEGLVKRDQFGRLISAISQSWMHSADYRVWTFTIAGGAKFHNGKPVTATDIKRAWERSVREGNWISGANLASVFPLFLIEGAISYRNNVTEQISGIRVLDDFRLQVTLKSSHPEFMEQLTSPMAWITTQADQLHPIGTGPFRLASYSATEIQLAANSDYAWDRPYLDGATFHYYADVRKALLHFEVRVLDGLYQIWINRLLIRRRSPLSLILEKELVAFRSGTGITSSAYGGAKTPTRKFK